MCIFVSIFLSVCLYLSGHASEICLNPIGTNVTINLQGLSFVVCRLNLILKEGKSCHFPELCASIFILTSLISVIQFFYHNSVFVAWCLFVTWVCVFVSKFVIIFFCFFCILPFFLEDSTHEIRNLRWHRQFFDLFIVLSPQTSKSQRCPKLNNLKKKTSLDVWYSNLGENPQMVLFKLFTCHILSNTPHRAFYFLTKV